MRKEICNVGSEMNKNYALTNRKTFLKHKTFILKLKFLCHRTFITVIYVKAHD